NVQRVNIVVAQLTVARVPEPVPVVVKLRPRQRTHRRGPGEEIIIHARGDFVLAGSADGIAPAIDDAAGQFHFAQLALVNVLDGFGRGFVRAVLGSALADAAVLARRLHDAPAFADIVAHRLLDVHILARLHGPDGGQRVPVIGRGDEHGGDGFVI